MYIYIIPAQHPKHTLFVSKIRFLSFCSSLWALRCLQSGQPRKPRQPSQPGKPAKAALADILLSFSVYLYAPANRPTSV